MPRTNQIKPTISFATNYSKSAKNYRPRRFSPNIPLATPTLKIITHNRTNPFLFHEIHNINYYKQKSLAICQPGFSLFYRKRY